MKLHPEIRRMMRELDEFGETLVTLDDVSDVPRYTVDTDEEFKQRRIARARQRLYYAGFYLHRDCGHPIEQRVETEVVTDSQGVYVAGRLR